nr:MAG TPA: hypothetical protein [Bacteriophage sp.]
MGRLAETLRSGASAAGWSPGSDYGRPKRKKGGRPYQERTAANQKKKGSYIIAQVKENEKNKQQGS